MNVDRLETLKHEFFCVPPGLSSERARFLAKSNFQRLELPRYHELG